MFSEHHLFAEIVNSNSHNNEASNEMDEYYVVALSYLSVYAVIGFLLSLFATVYIIGAHKVCI